MTKEREPGKDWGKIMVATRYQPQLPAWTCESLIGLVEFGLHNAKPELVDYVAKLEELLSAYGIARPPRPDALLRQGDRRDIVHSKTMHKAANMLTRAFLETDCDSLGFIDSDAVFGTAALEELRSDPEGWEYDVLQAFTVKRGWPPEPMFLTEMAVQPESEERLRGLHLVTNLPIDPDHIYPVAAASLHFTLIRRWVLEAMLEAEGPRFTYWFEYSRDNGEDITFSANARKVGARLGMTTRLKVGHVSDVVTGWGSMVDYYDRLFAYQEGEPLASLQRLQGYYEAQRDLAALVAEYTGEDPETVFQKSCSGGWAVADQWRVKQPQSADAVRDFYGTTPAYFYDLVKWNTTPLFQKLLGQLAGVSGERILEIGGGIGTMTEFLATHGNRIDYYDVPGVLRDFAAWRFQRLEPYFDSLVAKNGDDTPYRPIQLIERWEEGVYDRVIAIDVLEHIHPEEIERMLAGIAFALKPGGLLFAHNNWSQQEGAYPFHFDHSDAWAKFLDAHGFQALDAFTWRKR